MMVNKRDDIAMIPRGVAMSVIAANALIAAVSLSGRGHPVDPAESDPPRRLVPVPEVPHDQWRELQRPSTKRQRRRRRGRGE